VGDDAPSEHAPTEPTETVSAEPATRRVRGDTKQAFVVDMLRRPEGATIAELVEATGWQPHTVRGPFAEALRRDWA